MSEDEAARIKTLHAACKLLWLSRDDRIGMFWYPSVGLFGAIPLHIEQGYAGGVQLWFMGFSLIIQAKH